MRKLFIIIAIAVFHHGYSQNRLEIDSLFANAYKTKKLDSLKWQTGTEAFTYLKNNVLVAQTVKSSKEKEVVSLEELNKITEQNFEYFPAHSWVDPNVLRVYTSLYFGVIDIKSGKVLYKADIDSGASNLTISKSNNIAYSLDSTIVIIDNTGKKYTAIEKATNVAYGFIPYRNEFGSKAGMIWSNDGGKLLFYKTDFTGVPKETFYDSSGMAIKTVHYPYAGGNYGETQIGVFSILDQSVTMINAEKGKYLTVPAWSPDGNSVYICLLNRAQNNVQMKEYDVVSGDYVRMVIKETADKYLEPQQTPIFLKSKPEFLWLSTKEGRNHLYHYDVEGLLLSPLTTGDWDIINIVGVDDKEENVYFIGTTEEDVTGRYLYRANIISLQVTKISAVEGSHTTVIDYTDGNIIDLYTNYETPCKINLKDGKGKLIREIYTAPSPFHFVDVPSLEHGTLRASDGKTDLHYHIYKPDDFNTSELYPVILYVYGGPHVQLVTNHWMGGVGIMPYLLAQEGFIVMVLDNRGSFGRGIEFEQKTHLKLGQIELEDQLTALKYLSDLSYIDETRIGVTGWSFGGFMSLTLATKAPGKIKVAVAGAPVTSWSNYEVMYTERYMGTPESNPDGYTWSDLAQQTSALQSKVLILDGNLDDTTVPRQHKMYVDSAKANGKDVRLHTFWGHKHHVTGDDRKDMIELTVDFFVDFL